MAVDPFLLGENLTALTITGLTKNADGSFVVGSTINVVDDFLEIDPTARRTNEDVRPTNQRQENETPTGTGSELRISCLQRSAAANAITTLVNAPYGYFQVDWTQGAEVFRFRGILRSWNAGIKQRGANPVTLELGPINEAGAANLVRISP